MVDNGRGKVYYKRVHKIVDSKKGDGEMKSNALRGRIVAMYGTLDAFAKAIGWSKRKVSYIVNGQQEPTGKDIECMASTLQVEIPSELKLLFFP